jgi:hypothetical protein
MTWGTAQHSLSQWWHHFKTRNIVAPDPSEVFAQRPVSPRIVPATFMRPNGNLEGDWRVIAQNDAARAELLYCVYCLPRQYQ